MRKMYAERRRTSSPTRCPGLDPAKVRFVKHHVAHAASAGPRRAATPTTTPSWCSTAAARRTATSPGATSTGSWRCWPARRSRTPSACCTRTSPTTWASCAAPTSSRSWRWPPTASRGSPASCPSSSAPPTTAASAPRGSTSPSSRPAWARATSGPRRTPTSPPASSTRLEEVLLDLARWLHEQTGDTDAHPGRRHRAQLRGQHPHPRREPVRAGLGAARRRRRRHRAGRRPARRPRARRATPSRCPAPTSAAAGPTTRSSRS